MSRANWMKWLALAAVLAVGQPALAEVIWQPPWVTNPTDPQWAGGVTTHQRWEFSVEPVRPVVDNNPFGDPYVQVPPTSGHWPDPVLDWHNQPINTWHIDVPGGTFSIWVPNDPRPNAQKVIFTQITSDKAPDNPPATSPPAGSSNPAGGPAGLGGNWYVYAYQTTIPENPPGEWITFTFPESTNIAEVVVDTICVPEPVTLALLGMGGLGLIAARRRRK